MKNSKKAARRGWGLIDSRSKKQNRSPCKQLEAAQLWRNPFFHDSLQRETAEVSWAGFDQDELRLHQRPKFHFLLESQWVHQSKCISFILIIIRQLLFSFFPFSLLALHFHLLLPFSLTMSLCFQRNRPKCRFGSFFEWRSSFQGLASRWSWRRSRWFHWKGSRSSRNKGPWRGPGPRGIWRRKSSLIMCLLGVNWATRKRNSMWCWRQLTLHPK